MKRMLVRLSLLSALFFSACAPSRQAEMEDMADASNPSLYCLQLIAALATGQQERAIRLMANIGGGELTEEKRKGAELITQPMIFLSRGMSGGPMTQMVFHKDQTFPRSISHLTVETWENAAQQQLFFGCILTPKIDASTFIATDEAALKVKISNYYRDFIENRRNAGPASP
jgi:hypothetical protein